MSMYRHNGVEWEPISFSTLPGLRFSQKLDRFSQKWLKAILAAAFVLLLWGWATALAAPSYTMEDMRLYASVLQH